MDYYQFEEPGILSKTTPPALREKAPSYESLKPPLIISEDFKSLTKSFTESGRACTRAKFEECDEEGDFDEFFEAAESLDEVPYAQLKVVQLRALLKRRGKMGIGQLRERELIQCIEDDDRRIQMENSVVSNPMAAETLI